MEAREFGENRIMELMSKESEYGDELKARFRDARMLPGLGLFNLEPGITIFKCKVNFSSDSNYNNFKKQIFQKMYCNCYQKTKYLTEVGDIRRINSEKYKNI